MVESGHPKKNNTILSLNFPKIKMLRRSNIFVEKMNNIEKELRRSSIF
ncbi:hypothetical protein SAMN05421847_0385 [Halpernia humi]|uniref:Uncharacterized protein n=1 Tax=Halpernia humi TaxID=493375 RepID=A0A1H5T8V3_9FLAO|nr:hypothetical protein SAMN05421847_0385 [Halpernia humi]